MTTYIGYSDTTLRILNIVNSIHKAGIPHHIRLSFLRAGIKIIMYDTRPTIVIQIYRMMMNMYALKKNQNLRRIGR